jgi:hypothetical protein
MQTRYVNDKRAQLGISTAALGWTILGGARGHQPAENDRVDFYYRC